MIYKVRCVSQLTVITCSLSDVKCELETWSAGARLCPSAVPHSVMSSPPTRIQTREVISDADRVWILT